MRRHRRLAPLLVVVAGLVPGCRLFGPDYRDPPDLKVTPTAARLARGAYLVNHVAACYGCHTEGQKGVFSLPPKRDRRLGSGGDCFGPPLFPGELCGSNITPHPDGIGGWTDGELSRAIREGVNRAGDTLFPMMPYVHYRSMSDADVEAVIAWVRTATPAPGKVRPTDIDWPVSMFVNFAPQPLEGPVPDPDPADPVARGRYLATIGGCKQCHSPVDGRRQLVEDALYSGGQVFREEGVIHAVSPNLTPHATGLLRYDRDRFIARFKAFEAPESLAPVGPTGQSPMPWWAYAGMSEDDLGAIYDFLMTLPPIERAVVSFPDQPAGP